MINSAQARWAAALLVFAVTFSTLGSFFDPGSVLTGPDAIEHISIANALSLGHGFVNPIQWYFTLPGPPPLPAAATRAPILPLLLAGGFSLGANLTQVMYAHLGFSALVAAGMCLLGSRFMRPGLSVIATFLVVLTPAWLTASISPLSEMTALATCLLVVATAAGAGRSWKGAVLCALVTVLAWLARPNLAPMALAVVVAVAWDTRRPSELLRSPVVVYVGVLLGSFYAVSSLVTASTGLPPYEGYRHAFEHFPEARAYAYGTEYVGTGAFIGAHLGKIVSTCTSHATRLFSGLFLSSDFNYAGWLLLLATVSVLRWPSRARVEERVLVLSALGFCAIIVLTYPAFDLQRYALFPAALGGLVGMGVVERLLAGAEVRWSRLRSATVQRVGWVALIVASLVVVVSAPRRASTPAEPSPMTVICSFLEPGHLVMSDEPWTVHWACGNPVIRVPTDLKKGGIQDRFFSDLGPRYFVAMRKAWSRRALQDEEMTFLATNGRALAFEIDAAAPSTEPFSVLRPPQCLVDATAPGCLARVTH